MTTATTDNALLDTMRLIPGYDPFETAGPDCWFDEEAAQRAIAFFPGCLRHIEGAMYGEPFELEPWQEAIVGNLFGWKRTDSKGREIRRYRKLFLYVPRKNGKTPLAAGIGLYVLFCDPERGQQGYVAAADKEQAGILFRHAKGMVEFEPELLARATIYGGTAPAGQSKSIVRNLDGSFLRVISADAESKHGGNLSIGIIDELHAQPNRELVDVLVTSMASANRPQPIMVYITTADWDRPSICNEEYEYAAKVRDGITADPTYLPVIYEAAKDQDWTTEEAWETANPNIEISVSLDYLQSECKRAQENAAFENEFKRLHLNIRTEQSMRLVQLSQWDECGSAVDLTQFDGMPAFAALDLSTVNDIAALVLVWRDGEDYVTHPWFWLPRATAERRQKQDRVEYLTWAKQGLIELTEGNSIDYRFIRNRVNELGRKHGIMEIAYDPWNASHLATELGDEDGFTMVQYRQGYVTMNEPTKLLLRLLSDGKLRHGGHPVLRWMAANLAGRSDPAGNLKPDKEKSADKIDGMVALIMALGRASTQPNNQPSISFI